MEGVDTAAVDGTGRLRPWHEAILESGPSAASAVSWGAIVAGAVSAAALSLLLLMLGVGLGLSAVSPWAHDGVGATTFGVSTIVWLTLTQLLASAMGGYLAGRLRTKWAAAHADEVYFRDTAHGFLAWAMASLVSAALLTSAIGAILGTGVQAGATVTSGAVAAATVAGPSTTAGGPAALPAPDADTAQATQSQRHLRRPAARSVITTVEQLPPLETSMRSPLLLFLGIPIPIIILIALFVS